jgi:hypothetical protein
MQRADRKLRAEREAFSRSTSNASERTAHPIFALFGLVQTPLKMLNSKKKGLNPLDRWLPRLAAQP